MKLNPVTYVAVMQSSPGYKCLMTYHMMYTEWYDGYIHAWFNTQVIMNDEESYSSSTSSNV